ncbi:MAG: hypothetical protein ACRCYY_14130 [Trueperaceae bacterium]
MKYLTVGFSRKANFKAYFVVEAVTVFLANPPLPVPGLAKETVAVRSAVNMISVVIVFFICVISLKNFMFSTFLVLFEK